MSRRAALADARPRRRLAPLLVPLLLPLALSLTGCASDPVQPWEKGMLARPEMSFDGDRLEGRYNEHIYFSKEAASGGAGVGGGGCGCN